MGEIFTHEAVLWFLGTLKAPDVYYCSLKGYLEMGSFGPVAIRPCDVVRSLEIGLGWDFFQRGFEYEGLHAGMENLVNMPFRDEFAVEIVVAPDLVDSLELFLMCLMRSSRRIGCWRRRE